MELREYEKTLIELLRHFDNDRSLKHLPEVWIKRLHILKSRDMVYNVTNDVLSNTFGEGDAEAFINCKRNWERIRDIMHNGNCHLECQVPMQKFEDKEILEDQGNYLDIWMANRKARRLEGYDA